MNWRTCEECGKRPARERKGPGGPQPRTCEECMRERNRRAFNLSQARRRRRQREARGRPVEPPTACRHCGGRLESPSVPGKKGGWKEVCGRCSRRLKRERVGRWKFDKSRADYEARTGGPHACVECGLLFPPSTNLMRKRCLRCLGDYRARLARENYLRRRSGSSAPLRAPPRPRPRKCAECGAACMMVRRQKYCRECASRRLVAKQKSYRRGAVPVA